MKAILLILLASLAGATAQVEFDGTDDFIHSSAADAFGALNFTNEISISFWVMKRAGIGTDREFVTKGRVHNGNNAGWHVRNQSAKFEFYFTNPSATFRIFSTTGTWPQTNVWIHVAFCYNWTSSNSAQFYVDGARVAGAWTANPANTTGLTNVEPVRIGASFAGSYARCQLQEVAIWNAVLGDDEVKNLACSRLLVMPRQVRPSALRFYLPLDASQFPPWTTCSGSNAFESVVFDPAGARHRVPATPLNSPQQRPNTLLTPP